ncbi:hypothetical protein BC941DRAFT_469566 [Chlamydoabsidia padenii]|nr:hypothetical protein BC941DRAFT_469566 [Chlamydoabsidia padenii]
MSDRPRRKRKQNNTVASNVHYVGYVEDEESVDAIMKKFEELERIQQEFSSMAVAKKEESSKSTNTGEATASTSGDTTQSSDQQGTKTDNTIDDNNEGMTEEQLEEIFKRTSAFTVKSAMMDLVAADELDALELWQVDFKDANTDVAFEEDDYIQVDDDFWDAEFGESPRKRGRRQPASSREKKVRTPGDRKAADRAKIIARYKVMKYQVRDHNGTMVMMKKRVNNIDPSLPTYIRLPGNPIPRSWAHTILQMEPPKPATNLEGARTLHVKNILATDLSTFGDDYSAILMDPPFLLPGEEPTPGKISIEDFAKFNPAHVVKAGFLFIWVEKEWNREMIRITKDWGFKYVENFCWIKKNVNNRIARTPFHYFNKSKLSLLIFRIGGEVDMRHQRNPDCVFDFVKPVEPDEISETKPKFIYNVIETMLPGALYHPETNPTGNRLLELWAKRNQHRTGWTTLVEDWQS